MEKNYPIGVFDSGLGGLSVVRTIRQLLPNESIVYYGDSKYAPYGTKSLEQVVARSADIVGTLLDLPVKAIVIACNTATSAAAEQLRNKYPDVVIIGMEPAIKPALQQSHSKICVLATEMTLREEKFNALIAQLNATNRIVKCPAPQLVEYVESARQDEVQLRAILDELLLDSCGKVDAIVLGCTHYLFVKAQIQDYLGSHIKVYDGNMGTALHLKNRLEQLDLLADTDARPELTIYNSAGEGMVKKSYTQIAVDKTDKNLLYCE